MVEFRTGRVQSTTELALHLDLEQRKMGRKIIDFGGIRLGTEVGDNLWMLVTGLNCR